MITDRLVYWAPGLARSLWSLMSRGVGYESRIPRITTGSPSMVDKCRKKGRRRPACPLQNGPD
jgi:hypothetical protein